MSHIAACSDNTGVSNRFRLSIFCAHHKIICCLFHIPVISTAFFCLLGPTENADMGYCKAVALLAKLASSVQRKIYKYHVGD